VPLIPPQTRYEAGRTQLDLRLTKLLQLSSNGGRDAAPPGAATAKGRVRVDAEGSVRLCYTKGLLAGISVDDGSRR